MRKFDARSVGTVRLSPSAARAVVSGVLLAGVMLGFLLAIFGASVLLIGSPVDRNAALGALVGGSGEGAAMLLVWLAASNRFK